MAPMGVARPQERTDKVPALSVEDEQGMVHVLLVVAMVVAAFLIAMGGISAVESKSRRIFFGAPFLARCVR
jgi:hypothetical protein